MRLQTYSTVRYCLHLVFCASLYVIAVSEHDDEVNHVPVLFWRFEKTCFGESPGLLAEPLVRLIYTVRLSSKQAPLFRSSSRPTNLRCHFSRRRLVL